MASLLEEDGIVERSVEADDDGFAVRQVRLHDFLDFCVEVLDRVFEFFDQLLVPLYEVETEHLLVLCEEGLDLLQHGGFDRADIFLDGCNRFMSAQVEVLEQRGRSCGVVFDPLRDCFFGSFEQDLGQLFGRDDMLSLVREVLLVLGDKVWVVPHGF